MGDPGRLRQVLTNLVANAVKFTAEGSIDVRVGLEDETPTQATLRFAVTDTGIGIPDDRCERLFEPFVQADPSTTRRFGGTGLGLSISKQLVELMGGAIGVESAPGVGSTFWFTVVLAKSAAVLAKPRTPMAPVSARQPSARILLADDSATNRILALRLLEKLGHRVDAVGDGAEALTALRTLPYDLVLMDVQMPEMDGFEATRAIRAPSTPLPVRRIPVVAMTAHALKGDRERCLEAGMDDYVAKPVDPGELAAVVERQLRRRSRPGGRVERASRAFDRAALLARIGGDEELARAVVATFVSDAAGTLPRIEAAIDAGEADLARRLAHTLKGAAGSAGANCVQEMAAAIEIAAASGDLGSAAPLLTRAVVELHRLRLAMRDHGLPTSAAEAS